MPILFRYLVRKYFHIFLLCVASFITLLLVFRFRELAQFAVLSASGKKTFFFTLHQIPLILPLAIPISNFIASFLLFQRMSLSHEITALRALCVPIKIILFPLVISSFLMGCFHFFLCNEMTPRSKQTSKDFLVAKTTENPLLLLERQHLMKKYPLYLSMKKDDSSTSAEDFLLIAPRGKNHSFLLLSIASLSYSEEELLGKDVTLVSYLPTDKEHTFDSFVIENQQTLSMAPKELMPLLKKEHSRMDSGLLPCEILYTQIKTTGSHPALVELLRRASLSLSVISFTLLGSIFGIQGVRRHSLKHLFTALSLFFIVILAYLSSKGLKQAPCFAAISLLGSHLFLWLTTWRRYRQIRGGLG